jgi:SOS-response transcriptional repressor LexA
MHVSSVSYQLGILARQGYIRRDPARPRAIVILGQGGAA